MSTKRAQREDFLPISEQMKAWSTALATELQDWPQVTQKSFFGFTALYRGKFMFAVLPRTRGIFKQHSVAFRFDNLSRKNQTLIENDSRVAAFDKHRTRWFTFDLSSDADLHGALEFLGRAFDAARTAKKSK